MRERLDREAFLFYRGTLICTLFRPTENGTSRYVTWFVGQTRCIQCSECASKKGFQCVGHVANGRDGYRRAVDPTTFRPEFGKREERCRRGVRCSVSNVLLKLAIPT